MTTTYTTYPDTAADADDIDLFEEAVIKPFASDDAEDVEVVAPEI